MGAREQLLAVGPIDGRYAEKVKALSPITSEFGLIQRRAAVEVGWLATLGSGILPDRKPLEQESLYRLSDITDSFSLVDAEQVKEIEKVTNHDVKAVENWLTEKLKDDPRFAEYLSLIHFGCTSEDITNLAYAMMLNDARNQVLVPGLHNVVADLESMAYSYGNIPMLGHTHGQPATPTTLGKEIAVFSDRIMESAEHLGSVAIIGKFNGATGNYNAVTVAYPEIDWPAVSRGFVKSLGFEFNEATTQIEPHDWIARYCNELALSNTAMTDLARDMWTYISMGYFKQRVKKNEVGSSTMPHKVNPIDFENAEANFGVANALLRHLAEKLPISRLQRDLSDSSAQRTFGEAFGHTVIAHGSLERGLGKAYPNEEKMADDLNDNWAVLTEAVQTVMRRYGIEGAYDRIKAASRGMEFSEESYHGLVESIDELPEEAKETLRQLTPATFVGRAPEIASLRFRTSEDQ
jgi:adenylosuccinate lyase